MSLYSNLMKLVEDCEAFYFQDYVVDGCTYRVFNYRLASYTDFCREDALEARGITFYLSDKEPECVSRPFKKFFNLRENPFTMDLMLEDYRHAFTKEDGSLITTYYNPHTGDFGVKSKQDFFSEQSKMAEGILNARPAAKKVLREAAKAGYSVIMELVSPANRIVLEYQKTELRFLGLRDTQTGQTYVMEPLDDNFVYDMMFDILEHISPAKPQNLFLHCKTSNMEQELQELTDIEGFVIHWADGTMAKLKTEWYRNLHHLKDSVNATRHLIEAIIDERIDDVKAMFATDEFTMDRIKAMEDIVIPKYNSLINTVEEFCLENKDLDIKSFAIKGQAELGNLFNLAIMKHKGKPMDYKEFAKKWQKEIFKVKDEDVTVE